MKFLVVFDYGYCDGCLENVTTLSTRNMHDHKSLYPLLRCTRWCPALLRPCAGSAPTPMRTTADRAATESLTPHWQWSISSLITCKRVALLLRKPRNRPHTVESWPQGRRKRWGLRWVIHALDRWVWFVIWYLCFGLVVILAYWLICVCCSICITLLEWIHQHSCASD